MMKWSAWQRGSTTTRLHVKVNQLKLHGFTCDNFRDNNKALVIEVKWKGSKNLMGPFNGRSTCRKDRTGKGFAGKGGIVEWDDEFQSLCSFRFKQSTWDLTFTLSHGETSGESRTILGKVSMNLAEMASKMEAVIHTRLNVKLNIEGMIIPIEVTLLVCLSFAEVRNAQDSAEIVNDSGECDKDKMVRRISYFRSFRKTNKEVKNSDDNRVISSDTDESWLTDSDGISGNGTSQNELEPSLLSSEAQLDSGQKSWFSKKRKWFSPRQPRRKVEPLIERTNEVDANPRAVENHSNSWDVREVSSRDGQAKLKTKMFFASFDQRSEKAAGESACSTLVAVIAHWLHSNQGTLPTTSQYDNLITQGSSEWQKLCNNEAYMNMFPNKHFELDTVLEADIRPLDVSTEKSFIGFFSLEKFDILKGHMSFDQIWREISHIPIFDEPKIYVVSWNDHFFVLKIEANAYYIIDSLGERLYEGCDKAYILVFDESSVISEGNEGRSEVICRGKECCSEFIKRFLAAVPLKQLEEEKKKKAFSDVILHQRLQIELHYSYSPPSLTSSVTSSSHSLF